MDELHLNLPAETFTLPANTTSVVPSEAISKAQEKIRVRLDAVETKLLKILSDIPTVTYLSEPKGHDVAERVSNNFISLLKLNRALYSVNVNIDALHLVGSVDIQKTPIVEQRLTELGEVGLAITPLEFDTRALEADVQRIIQTTPV